MTSIFGFKHYLQLVTSGDQQQAVLVLPEHAAVAAHHHHKFHIHVMFLQNSRPSFKLLQQLFLNMVTFQVPAPQSSLTRALIQSW
jgi:hypothetical protein